MKKRYKVLAHKLRPEKKKKSLQSLLAVMIPVSHLEKLVRKVRPFYTIFHHDPYLITSYWYVSYFCTLWSTYLDIHV